MASDRAGEIIKKGLTVFLGLDPEEDFGTAVARSATSRAETHSDLLTLFQLTVPLLFAMTLPECQGDSAVPAAIISAISAAEPSDLVDSGASAARLAAMTPMELGNGFRARDEQVVSDLLAVRGDYYHHLGNHNFGRAVDGRYATN
ncbi:hypothetical protein GXW82_08885 [Streptacidiphilus sp. 4-A2]|nr:hypothetical protein [Streptacidiphilus sp. 4-A2]